jgi:arsenical pump membrane protein
MWLPAAIGGLLVILTGLLPSNQAGEVLRSVAPVLIFLVGVTVIAELADVAGVFDVAAHRAAVLGRGQTFRLWLCVVALGTITTIALSLDTTAVLLTPVVLTLASRVGLPAVPFAMTTVWLANTASLLLPISNLTNLLAQNKIGVSSAGFAARMWFPALVAIIVTMLVLGLRYRRSLRGSYDIPERPAVSDRPLFWTALAVCVAIGPLAVTGVPIAWISSVGAVILSALVLVRRREVLRFSLVPWRLVLLVVGLFFVVGAWQLHGLNDLLAHVAGTGGSFFNRLQLTGISATGANVVNNLPAYAALQPLAGSADRLYALLLGVNLGPLVLLWGSLATLLWRERCIARGVQISWREFATVGIIGVPILLVTTTAAMMVTG